MLVAVLVPASEAAPWAVGEEERATVLVGDGVEG